MVTKRKERSDKILVMTTEAGEEYIIRVNGSDRAEMPANYCYDYSDRLSVRYPGCKLLIGTRVELFPFGVPDEVTELEIKRIYRGSHKGADEPKETRYVWQLNRHNEDGTVTPAGLVRVLGAGIRPRMSHRLDMHMITSTRLVTVFERDNPGYTVWPAFAETIGEATVAHWRAKGGVVDWRVPPGIYYDNPTYWSVEIYDTATGFELIHRLSLAYGNIAATKQTAYRYAKRHVEANQGTYYKVVAADSQERPIRDRKPLPAKRRTAKAREENLRICRFVERSHNAADDEGL